MKMKKISYLFILSIITMNIFASTSSFNVVENPFSHNVITKVDPNGWKKLDLKNQILQFLIML